MTKNENRHALQPAIQELDQRRNVVAQPDPPAGLHQMLAAHAAEFRVVTNQVGQLAPLLHQVAAGQAIDLLLEPRRAQNLAEDETGIVETERLIEVRRHEKMPSD